MIIKILFFLFIIQFFIYTQSEFQQFISHLYGLPTIEEKNTAIDSFMTYARTVGIPFIEGDFIYNCVSNFSAIARDFNG